MKFWLGSPWMKEGARNFHTLFHLSRDKAQSMQSQKCQDCFPMMPLFYWLQETMTLSFCAPLSPQVSALGEHLNLRPSPALRPMEIFQLTLISLWLRPSGNFGYVYTAQKQPTPQGPKVWAPASALKSTQQWNSPAAWARVVSWHGSATGFLCYVNILFVRE